MASSKALFTLHEGCQLKAPLSSRHPVLYTHTLCPYAQRVFLSLLLKAPIAFDVVHVDLSHKPRWYSNINPKGLVPAVTLDVRTLLESLDICRELEQLVPNPPLMPSSPAAQHQVQALLDHTSGIVSAGLDLVAGSTARHWGVGSRPSRAQQQRFEGACLQLTQALQASRGPFLCGSKPSLADVALMPFFERFRLCLRLTQGLDMAAVQGGHINAWLDVMMELPACQLSSPDPGLFASALQQHGSLDFFDYETYTACQLHPQLEAYTSLTGIQ